MNIQPTSALFFASVSKSTQPARQNSAALPASTADTVNISQAARDRYANATNNSKSADYAVSSAKSEFDTTKGTAELDIESYFTPPATGVNLDSIPLLLPSQKNIDELSSYISAHMPQLLADNDIPFPPENITYDNEGKIQLPTNYPYAVEFKQALQNNPVMERVLRTTSALSSTLVEMKKSIPFQQEYAQATSQAQADAAVAKYHGLFASNRQYDIIALNFNAAGTLSITHDGKPLSVA